jgi:serine phosphatase RsbU (regulator of sigma subunit)
MSDRVLVVEDDIAILRGLSDNIRAEGYDVLVASDGETGYRLIRDQQPDLVILDVMLPRLTGIEVCRRVRGEGVRTPIVMLTAHGTEDERVGGLDAGADDYVIKPFLLNELMARIRGLLKHRREWSSERDRLERDLRAAAAVQQRLLPQLAPVAATLECAGVCVPAQGVGGDYYDFIDVGDGLLALVVADVAGKGMPAALSMACIHGVLRTEAPRAGRRAAELTARLNATLCATMQPGRYATLFYGLYDDRARTLTYVNAGHPPPLLVRNNGAAGPEVVALAASTPPVGLFPQVSASDATISLRTGDCLLIFSDGVSEALNAGDEEFGRDRILAAVGAANLSAEALRDRLLDAVRQHAAGRPQFDDLTLIVGKVL